MKVDIDPKVKPLLANLLKLGIGNYLISSKFKHLCIENDIDQLWNSSIGYVISLSNALIYIPGYTGYAEEALGIFLQELGEVYNNEFINIFGKIIIDFDEWNNESINFDNIRKNLLDIGYSNSDLDYIVHILGNQKKTSFLRTMYKKVVNIVPTKRDIPSSSKDKSPWYKDRNTVITIATIIAILLAPMMGSTWDHYIDNFDTNPPQQSIDQEQVTPLSPSTTQITLPMSQPISVDSLNSVISDENGPSSKIQDTELKRVYEGDTAFFFNSTLSISLNSISYDGKPLRERVYAKIGSTGYDIIDFENKDVGEFITYNGSDTFGIQLTKISALSSADFLVTRMRDMGNE